MKCFNHHDVDAIGVCKSCSKGLCPECATEVGLSIACRDTCTEEVALIDRQIKRARRSVTAQKRNRMFMPSLFLVMGAVFVGTELHTIHRLGMASIMGFAFMGFGVVLIILNRRFYREIDAG